MIKAIIFDWAGVIGADGYWVWLRENVDNIEAVKEKLHTVSNIADKGDISTEEFIHEIAYYSGKPVNTVWTGIKQKIVLNYELISIIKRLRKQYKIALLSNFQFEWLDEIMTENNLYQLFDEVIISSKHKMIKPEPAIFQKMLDLLHVTKDEVIFVDDRDYHVNGAKKFGIKALLYTSNEQLLQDFKTLGIQL